MDKREKEVFVASLRSALEEASVVILTRQSGMTVDESLALRRKMLEAGATFKVAKNTLARLAVQGTSYDALADHFTGPTAIAFSSDPVAAARVTVAYSKTNAKLEIVCGAMGEKSLNAAEVKALAELPSLDELRGKIVGLLQAPAGKIARVVQAPASQLARVFSAYGQKSA